MSTENADGYIAGIWKALAVRQIHEAVDSIAVAPEWYDLLLPELLFNLRIVAGIPSTDEEIAWMEE